MIFYTDFCTKFTVVLCLLAFYSVTKIHAANSQHTVMQLLLVNLGAKLKPKGSDAHHVEKLLSTAYFGQAFVNSL